MTKITLIILFFRVAIADIFQEKKRKKREVTNHQSEYTNINGAMVQMSFLSFISDNREEPNR